MIQAPSSIRHSSSTGKKLIKPSSRQIKDKEIEPSSRAESGLMDANISVAVAFCAKPRTRSLSDKIRNYFVSGCNSDGKKMLA